MQPVKKKTDMSITDKNVQFLFNKILQQTHHYRVHFYIYEYE